MFRVRALEILEESESSEANRLEKVGHYLFDSLSFTEHFVPRSLTNPLVICFIRWVTAHMHGTLEPNSKFPALRCPQ